ncbi:MAG: hypothetical protein AB8F65_00160 [Woeseiaceae bacterium]
MAINTKVMIAASVLLAVSFWNRNDFPADIPLLPSVHNEPMQKRLSGKQPFTVDWKDQDYLIEPEYDYELTGLIVSFRHQDGSSRMHRLSNDKLNMLDLCVVWGDSANNPFLNKIKFWNGVFTCNFQTRDQAAWDAFDIYQISNNHLISATEEIRDSVQSIRIGDQIRVRGQLASYTSPGGSKRGTSTTREDTGNGACETIYVTEFDVLQRGVSMWRYVMYLAMALLLATLLVHFLSPHRARRN